jgi:hypothetical protein
MNKSLLMKGLLGGVSYFFLGWIVWGMLLAGFMETHTRDTVEAVARAEDAMVWWAMIAGCLAYGFLLAYVLLSRRTMGFVPSAMVGATVGFLMSTTFDLMTHSMMDMSDIVGIAGDIVAMTVVSGVVAGIMSFVGNSE